MPDVKIALTDDERRYLLELLDRTIQSAKVEEHRTRTPIYRKVVIREEELALSVMDKLRSPA